VPRCSGFTKEPILVLFHAGGYALIVECSKETISRNETCEDVGETPTDLDYEILYRKNE